MGRASELLAVLRDGSSLGIVCHNNPDPDTLASALALARIARTADLQEVAILYSGTISHQQNRAFVNLFDVDLVAYDDDERPRFDLIAFVDHSLPGRNNDLPAGATVDVVIDHHPADGVEARFVDRREAFGASATILTEYLEELDVDVGADLATALLFAIRRETLEFLRGVTAAEYGAAEYLHPKADVALLRRLANPAVTPGTVETIGHAIENRTHRGPVLVSHVGRTTERDALPQAADFLVTMEGVTTAVVSGVVESTIQLSARSTEPGTDVGELLSAAFSDVGSAGGHDDMAGGQIPLGIFADWAGGDPGREDELSDLVGDVVAKRVFRAAGVADREESTEE
jgi:nanoRNase/pAp phosphatase (c-di-AMP/oligoRNAs hydrolase)